ncbi:MAG TPA: class I SAM-dependent methyltransferase [Casimicrobiaceae bacterium]|nr:class I SAM-dependent methyltransferase [Casimicrobiaceae bacterium]
MANDQNVDAEAFHEFEKSGWESNVSEYDAAFARLTTQVAAALLDAVRTRSGVRLLDVATGPGYVAAAAAARGASVTGIDFSAPMIAHARRINPAIEFREGDAEALSFPDNVFDAMVMNFGMLHLARPELAMAEAARVLKPGGRFAFTVWDKPEQAMGFGIMLNAIQLHGNPQVNIPGGPPFFRFSDSAECERTLREAGLAEIRVQQLPLRWRFNRPDELFDAIFKGGVRIRAILRAQSGDAFEAIRLAAREATSKFTRDGVIELPMAAILASAAKPD